MKIMQRRGPLSGGVACAAFLAASCLPAAASASYSASTDTAADILDYIENERRTARENRLTEAQEQLVKDTAAMQAHLRQPMEDHLKPLPTAFEGDELFLRFRQAILPCRTPLVFDVVEDIRRRICR